MISKFTFEDDRLLAQETQEALARALEGLAESDLPFSVETIKASAEQIRSLNARERDIDRVTDVLSFPAMDLVRGEPILSDEHGECVAPAYFEEDGELVSEDRMFLGSVVVCEERAREQAEEYGHSYARELCYLVVHGILHCLGYDHETEEDKREMREKEEQVMKKLGLERKE